MITIEVKSGINEIQEFLKEKVINYQIKLREEVGVGVIIDILSKGLELIYLLNELKRWQKKKNKERPIILIIHNLEININNASEQEIKEIFK